MLQTDGKSTHTENPLTPPTLGLRANASWGDVVRRGGGGWTVGTGFGISYHKTTAYKQSISEERTLDGVIAYEKGEVEYESRAGQKQC